MKTSRQNCLSFLFFLLLALFSPDVQKCWSQPEMVLQIGNASPDRYASFSPDGRWLATGNDDGTIKVWLEPTGQLYRTITIPGEGIFSLNISSHGWVAAGISHGTSDELTEWSVSTGQRLWQTDGKLAVVSRDEKELIGCDDKNFFVWDSHNGHVLETWPMVKNQTVFSLALMRDGSHIVTCGAGINTNVNGGPVSDSHSSSLRIWDIRTGFLDAVLTNSFPYTSLVAVSPDGKWFATGGSNNLVDIYTLHDRLSCQLNIGKGMLAISLAPSLDGRSLIVGEDCEYPDFMPSVDKGVDNTNIAAIKIFDVRSGRQTHILKGVVSPVMVAVPNPQNHSIFAGSGNNGTWNPEDGKNLSLLLPGLPPISILQFSPDGHYLLSSGGIPFVNVWHVEDRSLDHCFLYDGPPVGAAAWSPDGDEIASAMTSGTVDVWNVVTNLERVVQPDPVQAQMSPGPGATNRQAIVYVGNDKVITADEYSGLRGYSASPAALPLPQISGAAGVAVSPDDSELVAITEPGGLTAWDLKSQKLLWKNENEGKGFPFQNGHTEFIVDGIVWSFDSIYDLQFSPDGKTVATVVAATAAKPKIRIYNAGDGSVAALLDIFPTDQVGAQGLDIAYSPDSSRIAEGGSDGKVTIWNIAARQQVLAIQSPFSRVWALAYSPDGKTIAVGGDSQTVALYDANSGSELACLTALPKPSEWISYVPNGNYESSSGASSYIEWLNQAELFPASKFEQEFRQPTPHP